MSSGSDYKPSEHSRLSYESTYDEYIPPVNYDSLTTHLSTMKELYKVESVTAAITKWKSDRMVAALFTKFAGRVLVMGEEDWLAILDYNSQPPNSVMEVGNSDQLKLALTFESDERFKEFLDRRGLGILSELRKQLEKLPKDLSTNRTLCSSEGSESNVPSRT